MALKNQIKNKITKFSVLIIISVILSILLNKVYTLLMGKYYPQFYITNGSERVLIFAFIVFFITIHFIIRPKIIYSFVYKYRFLIGALVFVICVIFEVHGSSMAMINGNIQPNSPKSTNAYSILGIPRAIRSDEWMVFTPLAMSQKFNNYKSTNDISCAYPTNMLTVYNQPVLDITMIAKPFYWGYLLFGSAKGLSWFWAGRFIALLLVTFELFMIITKKDKLMSLAASFLITLSPLVAWWYSINFLIEMFVFGFLALIMIYKFLNTNIVKWKIIQTIIFSLCGCGFIFALYPAWMVPIGYICLGLAVWILIENFNNVKRSKSEFIYLFGAVLFIGVIVLLWLKSSKDAFNIMLNTAYPGKRVSFGGGGIFHLFYYINNVLTPFFETPNPCEPASFLGFFPITEIFAIIFLIKNKFKDSLLFILLVINFIFITFLCFGFPEIISKLTIFSQVTVSRIAPFISLIDVFIYIRIFSTIKEPIFKKVHLKLITFIICGGTSIWFVLSAKKYIPKVFIPSIGYPIWYLGLFILLMFGFISLFLVKINKRLKFIIFAFAFTISLIQGGTVNPIMRSVDAIYGTPLSKYVTKLQSENPGNWLGGHILSDYLIALGAPTINSTNIIPVLNRWEKLDPEGEYNYIYNRYAHINFEITSEITKFHLLNDDSFKVFLTIDDIKKLSINYICVNEGDSEKLKENNEAFKEIYNLDGVIIYEVKY